MLFWGRPRIFDVKTPFWGRNPLKWWRNRAAIPLALFFPFSSVIEPAPLREWRKAIPIDIQVVPSSEWCERNFSQRSRTLIQPNHSGSSTISPSWLSSVAVVVRSDRLTFGNSACFFTTTETWIFYIVPNNQTIERTKGAFIKQPLRAHVHKSDLYMRAFYDSK